MINIKWFHHLMIGPFIVRKRSIGRNKGKIANKIKLGKSGGLGERNSNTMTVIKLFSLTVIKLFQFIYFIHNMWLFYFISIVTSSCLFISHSKTIVSQLSKCLKFITFREGCFVIRN